MKKVVHKKKLLIMLLLGFFLFAKPSDSFAAFPIQQQATVKVFAAQDSVQTMTTLQQSKLKTMPSKAKKEEERSGINGILAFTFGLFGWFPLAIIFGIIGSEPGRKYREFAQVGLILGIVYGVIFIIYVGLLFYTL